MNDKEKRHAALVDQLHFMRSAALRTLPECAGAGAAERAVEIAHNLWLAYDAEVAPLRAEIAKLEDELHSELEAALGPLLPRPTGSRPGPHIRLVGDEPEPE